MTIRILLRTMALFGIPLGSTNVRADLVYVTNISQGDAQNPSISVIDTPTGQASPLVTTLTDIPSAQKPKTCWA
jgi:hypothetical protein